jgi:transglutaminase-like putative cysteine protease
MGIPARHVIGRIVEKDDVFHGWVEFYIDNEWIPCDPTYPEYKGKKLYGYEDSAFIVFHRGINMELELCGFKFPFGILQAYTYTYLLKNNGRMTPTVKALWKKN